MRVVFGILFTAVLLIALAQFAVSEYFVWQCYGGDQHACFMISKKNDVTLYQR